MKRAEPSLEELAEQFTPSGSVSKLLSGFLRPDQKKALAKVLKGSQQSIRSFIADVDGWCCIYAHLSAQPGVEEHREELRRIANQLYDTWEELDRLRTEVSLRRQHRFADTAIANSREISATNRNFTKLTWMASHAVMNVAHEIRRELSPCWPPHGTHITYVPPLRPKRKAGRLSVHEHLFTELVIEIARAYEYRFKHRPVSTRATSFPTFIGAIAKIVGYPASLDPSKVIRAALKLAFP